MTGEKNKLKYYVYASIIGDFLCLPMYSVYEVLFMYVSKPPLHRTCYGASHWMSVSPMNKSHIYSVV